MPRPDLPPPSVEPLQWVRTTGELARLETRLRTARQLAVDSESDSLHHFPEKVCLIQLALENGEVFLVDPLALADLGPLAPILADPTVVKIFHGAAYDLAAMKRDFGFRIAGLFDTMVAAQFVGKPELGLADLLAGVLGIAPGRSLQKDDWAHRPLSPAQERYAAEDVRHLIALRAHLSEALRVRRRQDWVTEECRALEATPAAERTFHPDDCFRLKGVGALDPRGLAVLRELFVARERWARERGRPPFRVMGNDTLLRLAAARPRSEDLPTIPGCTPLMIKRYGREVLEAISRGVAIPESSLPVRRRPKKPRLGQAVERRIEALLSWRTEAAPRLDLDPGLLLPRRLIERLAQAAPRDLTALAAVDGIREWRAAHVGQEILAVLAEADRLPGRSQGRIGQEGEAGGRSG